MEKQSLLKVEQGEAKMATTPVRFRKQVPTDVWSVKERLALGCSVLRSGDQNWVSVSRAIKPFAEPYRPNDWFSQKNCALQYSDLLEKVETPKRKRVDRSEVETPGDQIVRKLTADRIEELKKVIQEEQQKYKRLKREVEAIKGGQFDDKLPQIWKEMQHAKKTTQEMAIAAQQKANEESAARAAAAAAARVPGKPVAVPNKLKRPQTGLKLKTSLEPDDTPVEMLPNAENIKIEDPGSTTQQVLPIPGASTPQGTEVKLRATPPSSPLLSSLLQNKQELQKALAAQQVPVVSPSVFESKLMPAMPENIAAQAILQQSPVASSSITHQNKVDLVNLPIPTIDIKEEPMDRDLAFAIAEETIIEDVLASSILEPTVPHTTPHKSPVSSTTTSPIAQTIVPTVTSSSVTVKTEALSSPSIGAPTLSRLLVTPSGHAPLKFSTSQNTTAAAAPTTGATSSPSAQKSSLITVTTAAPPSSSTPTVTSTPMSSRMAKPAPAETKEVVPVSKMTIPDPPPTPPTPTPITPKKEKPERTRSASSDKDVTPSHELTLIEPPKVATFTEDEPASPASSIVSNETDSGSAKGGRSGRKSGQRRGKGNNRRISQRITRGRIQEDEKAASSGKPSEAESSDEEGTQATESDDGASSVTPKLNLSISESIPNSPASISQCDTEDEKAYKVWKKSIMLVWRAAANHKYANVFLHPVTNEIAPGYLNVVSRPMDLSMIKKNIESGALRTTAEFQRDMMLMFTNAIMYNNSDHDVYNMAVEMYNDVMVHIEQYVNTQMMVQSEGTKHLRPSRRSEASMSDKEEEAKKRKPSTESDPHGTGGKKKRGK